MFVPSSRFTFSFRRLESNSRRRRAFSLLEVAIALVIFVIGAIALLRIFPPGLDVLENSGNRRIASQMSKNLRDSFQAASSVPDEIYDWDADSTANGKWNDYPFSATGLTRDKGTLPSDAEGFGTSGAGHLRFIRGEHQTPVTDTTTGITSVSSNFVTTGRVTAYREARVQGVVVNPNTGQMDFKSATYATTNRTTSASSEFRESYITDTISFGPPSPAPTPLATPLPPAPTPTPYPTPQAPTHSDGTITIHRAVYDTQYQVIFGFNPVKASDTPAGTVVSNVSSVSPVAAPTVTTQANSLTLTFNVPMDVPGDPAQVMSLDLVSPEGVSVERKRYVFVFVGSSGAPATVDTPGNKLAIRAPLNLRESVTYYPSPETGSGGAYRLPIDLPAIDANYPQAETYDATNANFLRTSVGTGITGLQETLFFRQRLGVYAGDRIQFDFVNQPPTAATPIYPDVTDTFGPSNLSRVALDYNVYDWTFLTEFANQFGTPFPGDQGQIPPASNSADALVFRQFFFNENATIQQPIVRSDIAEIRTSIGNLRGPIYIKGLYDTGFSSDIRFNPGDTPANYATLSRQEQVAFRKKMADTTKQGRFYLPLHLPTLAPVPPATTGVTPTLQNARLYYRSRDGWAQQISVAATHYIPFNAVGGALREPWREYFRGTDGYLYFHAPDAGKTLSLTYQTSPIRLSSTIEIKPDVQFYATLPAGVPTAFSGATFQNPTNPKDPRNGRYFLARSRDTVSGAIYDLGRAHGSSLSVRTLWLNSRRYSQEVAQ